MKPKLLAAAVLAVLLATSWPSTAAVENGDEGEPAILTPNVLTVDSATGAVTYTDNEHSLTDVRVLGVESAASGFDLTDPNGVVVFGNQSSTFAGVVEFWYQVLMVGNYTVTGPAIGDGELNLTFDATPYGTTVVKPKAPPTDVKQPGVKSPYIDQPSPSPKKPAPPKGIDARYNTPDPDDPPRLPGPPRVPTLPCDTAAECQTLVCQLTPGNCNVPTPTIGPCPPGKVGYTANGAQTTCVNRPTLPCDTAAECEDLVCQFMPGNCEISTPTIGPCPPGKAGYTVDGDETACVNVTQNLPCGDADSPDCADFVCQTARPSGGCYVEPEVPDASNTPQPDPGNPPNTDCANVGTTAQKLEERILWTPLIINHAPYLGTSTATQTWQRGVSVYKFPAGYESSQQTSYKADIQDGGKTTGHFQLAKWGLYDVTQSSYCDNFSVTRTAKVIDWEPHGYVDVGPFDLDGSSRQTDADDYSQVSQSGYDSVKFNTRYVKKDRQHWTTSTQDLHLGIGNSVYSRIGGSIGFSKGPVSAEVLEFSAKKSEGASYDYYFPKGPHCWDVDELGAGSTGGLAFKYRGAFVCPSS